MYFIIWTSGSIVHHIFISVNFANFQIYCIRSPTLVIWVDDWGGNLNWTSMLWTTSLFWNHASTSRPDIDQPFASSSYYVYFDGHTIKTTSLQTYISKSERRKQNTTTGTWASPWRAVDKCALFVIDLDSDLQTVRNSGPWTFSNLSRKQWNLISHSSLTYEKHIKFSWWWDSV